MAKTTVTNLLAQVKRRVDYDITDTDLTNLLVDFTNDNLKIIRQWFIDEGIPWDNSASSKFMTVAGQDYVDPNTAVIVGDSTTFTGIAGDTIDVTIDSTAYADIDISACTTIALVVTAINTAVGSTVADTDENDYLRITGTTNVTIADGTSTVQTVIAELFSISDHRTCTAITDLEEILKLHEYINDRDIEIVPYSKLIEWTPDPSEDTSNTPLYAARWQNYIYFSPRPNTANMIHIDYLKSLSDITSSSTLPFEARYDPILKAMVQLDFEKWKDATATGVHQSLQRKVDDLKLTLIYGTHNIGVIRQSASRDEDADTGPRAPQTGTFF